MFENKLFVIVIVIVIYNTLSQHHIILIVCGLFFLVHILTLKVLNF